MVEKMILGDFTGLGKNYADNRPDYSKSILNAILGLFEIETQTLKVADVGAGTGIWTRMIAEKNVQEIFAIEPNADMRSNAITEATLSKTTWTSGTAENTGLQSSSIDWVTMASSFHWANFDLATKEFHRILSPGGFFTALWNPRLIEANPLLVEIEEYAKSLSMNASRVSSGMSGITKTLTQDLRSSKYFDNVVYMEATHIINMTPERYVGAWKSVNDLQVKIGNEKFSEFIEYVNDKVVKLKHIECTYLTRAWTAQKIGS